MTPRDRERTLEWVKERLNNPDDDDWTLVATSCVEAGVDISFRTGIRERASLSSLLQIGGRVNREGTLKNAAVWDIQLKHDAWLRKHPAFDVSSVILGDLFKDGLVGPRWCSEAEKT